MDTKAIRYFWRVYEERSINKAANQLFITPQGLSKIIRNLEEELGAELFVRTPKGMEPTESGVWLYAHCGPILEKYGELKDEAFITLNERFASYHNFVQRCQDFHFTPNILVKTMESQLIYRFCRQKLGLGIDVNIHEKDINLDHLKRVELYDAIPWRISIIIRKDRMEETLIRQVKEVFIV